MAEITQLSSVELEKLATFAKGNFYFFAKAICGFKDLNERIHKPLCDKLQNATPGLRARIILPRGWFKTTVCSIAYPVWRALKNPNIRILLAQNTATNAEAKLRSIRGIFESNDLFKALFPDILPTKECIWQKNSLCVNRSEKQQVESTFEAVGVNTQVVSRHYDIIIEDDTVAPDLNELGEESLAPSKDDIGQAIGWHRLASPLLVHLEQSDILVVGTRWFDHDLLSYIGNKETYYESYIRACREDKDGKSSPTGEVTYPERFSAGTLEKLELALGPYMYACLYLNNPLRSSDMIFKTAWFKFYADEPKQLSIYTTVDLAGDPEKSKGTDTDYNVILTTGKDLKTGRIYVLSYWRRRANPGEVLDELFSQVKAWKPIKVGIETIAYQNTFEYWVIERMRKENFFFTIEPITHGKVSKNARIQGLQPIFASGTILLRPHMQSLQQELEAFPLGAHDDLADCLSMQQKFWQLTAMVRKVIPQEDEFSTLTLDGLLSEIAENKKTRSTEVDDIMTQTFADPLGWN